MFRLPPITKNLLIINVLMFAATWVFGRIGIDLNNALGLHFFLAPDFQIYQLFTYMFMHAGLLHILFNMLWLYWFGQLFLNSFSARHLRGLYMLSYNIFPYFRPMLEDSYLLGASASVLAVVAAVAYRDPDYPVRFLLLGTVRMKYLALIVIGLDLLFITSANAGGHIAHLGGALAGLWFAASLNKGHDTTAWINRLIDILSSLFSPKTRRPKMTVHPGGGRRQEYDYNARKKAQNDEIDRILDKLKQSGYDSLTTDEKRSLFDASKR